MKLYMTLFSRADGAHVEPLGVYFDFEQARAAVRDSCVERHMAERPEDNRLVAQEAAVALRWRHHQPHHEEGRHLELWTARDQHLDYYLVWRCEGGVRPWAQSAASTESGVSDLPGHLWTLTPGTSLLQDRTLAVRED